METEIQKSEENNCLVSCTGLYADIVHGSGLSSKGQEILSSLEAEYFQYKTNYARNIIFDPTSDDLSMYYETLVLRLNCVFSSASAEKFAKLHVVKIYFDTASYDEIERDEKVLFIAQ